MTQPPDDSRKAPASTDDPGRLLRADRPAEHVDLAHVDPRDAEIAELREILAHALAAPG